MTQTLPTLTGACGAAFLLRVPAGISTTIQHSDGLIRFVDGAPFITIEKTTVESFDSVRDSCWKTLQEALDIRATTHREAYATKDGDHNFLTWKKEAGGYVLRVTETISGTFDIKGIITIKNPDGTPTPSYPEYQSISHHPAMRYYRLSQLSDDLYDAFRNAYLALEYLVSEISPKKPNESEIDWLKRVLGGRLLPAIPGNWDVQTLVQDIYRHGRLPLFHAKAGHPIFLPQGNERSNVRNTFEQLQILLARVFNHEIDARAPASWATMSTGLVDARAAVVYRADKVILSDENKEFSLNTSFNISSTPRHFGCIWGIAKIPNNSPLDALKKIEFFNQEEDWFSIDLMGRVPLTDVVEIHVEVRQTHGHTRSPKRLHHQ